MATVSDAKSGKVKTSKTSILLTCIGERDREIYETFEFASEVSFLLHSQAEGQSFSNFITELRPLSAECELKNLRDSLIKDMITCGVNDKALRERMLREPKIDLKKAIELGQAAEQTKLHAKQLSNQMDRSLSKITHRKKKSKKQSVAAAAPSDTEEKQHKSDGSRMIKHCKFCAGSQ